MRTTTRVYLFSLRQHILLTCFFLLALAPALPAQLNEHSPFEHLSKEQGLPGSFVTCLYQDRQGFVWVGTNEGLARYDGYAFTVYRKEPSDPFSLSANDVGAIYEDRSGALWIGTGSGGLNRFDRETGRFLRFQHDSNDSLSLGHNYITAIYEDREGFLWAGGMHGNGLNRLDRKTGHWKRYLPDKNNPGSLQGKRVNGITEDQSGRLWVNTYDAGLSCFDRKTEQFRHYVMPEEQTTDASSRKILAICPGKDGMLWLWSENGFYCFDPENGAYKDIYRRPAAVTAATTTTSVIAQEPSGVLWVSWGAGISRFDPVKKQFQDFLEPDRFTNCILVDREGLVWVGTDKGHQPVESLPKPVYGSRSGFHSFGSVA